MRSARRLSSCFVVAAVMGAATAFAQSGGGPAPSEEREARTEARRLFGEGLKHFNVGEYDIAIQKFKASYQREPAPGLLYDLAQAHRLKGDCGQALVLYRRYLAAKPQGKDRARVETRIIEMEECQRIEPKPAPASPVDPTSAATPPIPLEDTPMPVRSPQPALLQPLPAATGTFRPEAGMPGRSNEPDAAPIRSRKGAAALGAASLSFLAAGGYFAWDAGRASDAMSRRFANGGTYDVLARQDESRGTRSERLAIAGVAGAALTAAVAVWLFLRD